MPRKGGKGTGCRLPTKPAFSQLCDGGNPGVEFSGRNRGFRRLKWLESLYRPALPERIPQAGTVPPLSRQVIGASPSGKAGDFDSPMRRFESSRPSQAVRGSEKALPIVAERPANSGLLQFGVPSLGSRFPGMRAEFGESLWLTPRIFPFSGDCGRRQGSIALRGEGGGVDFVRFSDRETLGLRIRYTSCQATVS